MVIGPTRSEAVRLRWWVLIGLLVAGLGGFGLLMVVTRFWPNPAMELALLGLLGVTLAGLTIPVAAYLNHRFARTGWQAQDPRRLLRQGAWVGLLGALYGWLKKEDALNWTIAAVVAGVFALLEAFFLTRDQA
jgi:MFS family permease